MNFPQKTNTIVVEKRLDEVTQELRKSEGKNAALQTDLQSANSSLDVAHKECVTLKVKLQELERSLIGHDQAAKEKDEKLKVSSMKEIRWVFGDNLGIIFHVSMKTYVVGTH